MVFDGVLSWWTGKKQDEDSDDRQREDPPSSQPPTSVGTGEAQAENTLDIRTEVRQISDYLVANRRALRSHGVRITALEDNFKARRGTISQHDARISTLEQDFERLLQRLGQLYGDGRLGPLQDDNQISESNPPEDSCPNRGPDVPSLPNTTQAGGPPMLLGQLKDDNNYSQSLPPEDPGFGDVNDDDHESEDDPFDDHVLDDVDANPNIMQAQGPKRRGQLKDDNNYSQSTQAGNSIIDLYQQPDQDVPDSTQRHSSRQSNVRFSDGSTMESSTGSVDNTSPPKRSMSTAAANKRKLPEDQATSAELVSPATSPDDPPSAPSRNQVSGTSPDQPSGIAAAQESVPSPPDIDRRTSTIPSQGGQPGSESQFLTFHEVRYGVRANHCWPYGNLVAGFVLFPDVAAMEAYIATGQEIIEGQKLAVDIMTKLSRATNLSDDVYKQQAVTFFEMYVNDAYHRLVESFGKETVLPPLASSHGIPFSGEQLTFPKFLALGHLQKVPASRVQGYFLSSKFSCPMLKVQSFATCFVTHEEPDSSSDSELQKYLQAALIIACCVRGVCNNVPVGRGDEDAVLDELVKRGYSKMYTQFRKEYGLFRVFPWMYQIQKKIDRTTRDPLNYIVFGEGVSPPAQKKRRTADE
jgi:hypothetical protein